MQTASFPSVRLQTVAKRFQAKKDTLDKVCGIVKKQLAVDAGTPVNGETKFADLGADSLDTVEIVMGLEEEFGVTVDETNAQEIRTVEDAATLIDKLVMEKEG
ncbi:unnamed protein product [Alopecurus aequalis]